MNRGDGKPEHLIGLDEAASEERLLTAAGDHRPAAKRSGWLWLLAALLLAWLLLGAGYAALAREAQPVPVQAPNAAPSFDFAISKSTIPAKFSIGAKNAYVISVSYLITGADLVTPVFIDPLPLGLQIIGVRSVDNAWSCAIGQSNQVTCTYARALGRRDPGLLEPVFISVTVPSSQPSPITNAVTLVITDANSANNTATTVTPVDAVDLQITKSVTPKLVNVGDVVTYTISVKNNGPADAVGVVVSDTLSAYLVYTETSRTHGAPLSILTDINGNPKTGIWNIGNLPKNVTAKLVFIAEALPTALGRQIVNTAVVSSANIQELTPANNRATDAFIVGGLEIEKKVYDTDVFVGEVFTYTIDVRNVSNVQINGIVVSDVITPTLDILRAYVGATPVPVYSRNFSRNIGSLASGASARLTLYVRPNLNVVKDPTLIPNKATVSWTGTGATLSRSSNTVYITAHPAVNLQVGKTDGRTTVLSNQVITYTLSVTNTGSLTATNVIITDTVLTANLTLLSVSKDGAPIIGVITPTSSAPYTWVWRVVGPLEPGEKITWRVAAKVANNLSVGTLVTNSIRAYQKWSSSSPPFYEHVLSNNVYQDTDSITATPSLTIHKKVTPTKSKAGDDIAFRIEVTNDGGVAANGIKVTDVFPSVLDFVSNTASTGTATTNTSTRTLIWTIGTLNPGQSAVLVTVWRLNSTAQTGTTYENKALLNWNPNYGLWSNEVKFKLASGTLPDTGWPPADAQAQQAVALPGLALGGGILLAGLGLAALAAGFLARRRRPLWASSLTRWGLAVLALGALLILVGGMLRPGGSEQAGLPQPIRSTDGQPALALATPEPEASPTAGATVEEQNPVAGGSPTATLPAEVAAGQGQAGSNPDALWNAFITPTPTRLPEYAIPTPTAIPTAITGIPEPDPSAVTRIQIPALGVDTVVKYVPFNGETWLIGGLRQEVAWMGDTSWPGLGSNTGLAGHVDLADGSDGPFRRLSELHPGDLVILYTEKKIYTYQVREQKVVDEDDLSVIAPTEFPQITLITCTSWDHVLRDYLQRLVVIAVLIDIQPLAPAS